MKNLNELFENVKSQYEIIKSIWVEQGSPFAFLQNIQIDKRGKWGEHFIQGLVKFITDFEVIWKGDKNTRRKDKSVFDMIINFLKTEVKTATNGYDSGTHKLNNKWQHENIYQEGKDWEGRDGTKWDKVLFLDIDMNGFYITIIDRDDFCFEGKHPVFKKSATLRKTHNKSSEGAAYKFDLELSHLERGMEFGYTIYIDYNNFVSMEYVMIKELGEFFEKHFSD